MKLVKDMKGMKRVIGGACAVAALSLGSREAFAGQGERVIVVAGADERGGARLSEELASLSFEAKSVIADDASAPCDPIGIFASALEAGAVAAMCIDREAIRIWIGAEHGALRETIPLRDAAGGARTLVEVQAVEILRASLRNGGPGPVPLVAEFKMPAFEMNVIPDAPTMNAAADSAMSSPWQMCGPPSGSRAGCPLHRAWSSLSPATPCSSTRRGLMEPRR